MADRTAPPLDASPPGVVCDLEMETAMRRARVGWLGTTHPGGGPHLVPVWFFWDGTAIVLYSKPDAQKLRNLQNMPEVAFAVEPRARSMCSVLIEGRAEVLPLTDRLAAGFRNKYGRAIRSIGIDPSSFAHIYPTAIRITPQRMSKYGDFVAAEATAQATAQVPDVP